MPMEMWSFCVIDSPGPGGACLSIEPVFRCHESRCARELVIAVTHTDSWPDSTLVSKESSTQGLENEDAEFGSRVLVSPEEEPLSE